MEYTVKNKSDREHFMGGPPDDPFLFAGVALPIYPVHGKDPTHVFAIGSWGGLDAKFWKSAAKSQDGTVSFHTYAASAKDGLQTYPSPRWNLNRTAVICDQDALIQCLLTRGKAKCDPACSYRDNVDREAQLVVAKQFNQRAKLVKPKFILSSGDNLMGGIRKACGSPMSKISSEAAHQFATAFKKIYTGPGVDGVPWFNVLGNQDWGGHSFNNGWDQQIAFTWADARWMLPAPYYKQTFSFVDQHFDMDVLFLDSNAISAKDPQLDPDHNLCSEKFNSNQGEDNHSAACGIIGGPPSFGECRNWFRDFWKNNQDWAESQLNTSLSQWQVVVTTAPCGHEADWYRKLHLIYGLDLLITGQRRGQEIWAPGHPQWTRMGGLHCFVAGGGGGATSETSADRHHMYFESQYGFYDLVIRKHLLQVFSIDHTGKMLKMVQFGPHEPKKASYNWTAAHELP